MLRLEIQAYNSSNSFLKLCFCLFRMHVCACARVCMSACAHSLCVCASQRTSCRRWLSPPTMWVVRNKLRSKGWEVSASLTELISSTPLRSFHPHWSAQQLSCKLLVRPAYSVSFLSSLVSQTTGGLGLSKDHITLFYCYKLIFIMVKCHLAL